MKSLRISDELYQSAQIEAALMNRSVAQQLEHWVRLGVSLEASGLTAADVRKWLLKDRAQEHLTALSAPVAPTGRTKAR